MILSLDYHAMYVNMWEQMGIQWPVLEGTLDTCYMQEVGFEDLAVDPTGGIHAGQMYKEGFLGSFDLRAPLVIDSFDVLTWGKD